MEVLAARIKWLREKKRLGQKAVASEVGMSLNGYQKIEYDERDPSLSVLIKLAEVFNASTDFLLGINDITPELKKLSQAIKDEEGKLQRADNIIKKNDHDIRVIEQELAKLKDSLLSSGEELPKFRISQLEERLSRLVEIGEATKFRYYKVMGDYQKAMQQYILELLKTPYCEPSKDPILIENAPIHIGVFNSISDEGKKYSLNLILHDVTPIRLKEFDVKEEAEDEKEKVSELLGDLVKEEFDLF